MPDTLKNEAFAPELCRLAKDPPAGDAWLHEVKWDGYRILATVVKGKVRLWSRNAIEWTHKVPELAEAIASLKLKSAQLDGEMVVLRAGVSNFNALQGRLSAENAEPAIYVLFDMPYLNGANLRDAPLIERKAKLAALLKRRKNPLLAYSAHQVGHGREIFEQAQYNNLEGIVSKKVNSPYRGDRNGDWVKVKARPSDEFAVVGFTDPKGSRTGIGALLLAKHVRGEWVYIGRVGTGFTDKHLRALRKQLSSDVVATPRANTELMERKDRALAIWVEPKLVVEVFYQGFGGQGLLRQAAFKTLRADKTVESLIAEDRARAKKSRKK
ncbi:MAG TPA: non-homologous end-joining DNA ligase [Rhodanobacteraceae bacterium]|nr:non-homologous end-joining DNA ligase [Rhodanobacteraceae bacterium]